MIFRRRTPAAVRFGESVSWWLMILLRWISVTVLAILLVGLMLNFNLDWLKQQFLPTIFGLLIINVGFVEMHRFARGLRSAYDVEAEGRLRTVRPLVHNVPDHQPD